MPAGIASSMAAMMDDSWAEETLFSVGSYYIYLMSCDIGVNNTEYEVQSTDKKFARIRPGYNRSLFCCIRIRLFPGCPRKILLIAPVGESGGCNLRAGK